MYRPHIRLGRGGRYHPRWPDSRFTPSDKPWRCHDEPGALLEGMDAMGYDTADRRYYACLRQFANQFVQPDGLISTCGPAAHALDDILPGRQLLLLYRVPQDTAKAVPLRGSWWKSRSRFCLDSGLRLCGVRYLIRARSRRVCRRLSASLRVLAAQVSEEGAGRTLTMPVRVYA